MAEPAAARAQGPSMVQQHHAQLQQERETAGIQKLQSSLPKLCRPVLALALQDCEFDAERALLMLRQFQSDAFDNLRDINRRRKRVEAHASRPPAASDSDSGGSPRRKRSRSSSKHGKHSSKHKKSSKHKRHKDKHKHRRRRSRSLSDDGGELEFGAFGIIRESDYALKKPEFAAWATEVKHIDIESLPRGPDKVVVHGWRRADRTEMLRARRGDEHELWRSFMEDFNTCTLPERKYYDLAAHARKLARAAAAAGAPEAINTFVDDERLRREELMADHRAQQDQNARDAMAKMMLSGEHLQELREREMTRLQAQEAFKTGDMSKAQKLMKKLNPDEEDTRDLEHYN